MKTCKYRFYPLTLQRSGRTVECGLYPLPLPMRIQSGIYYLFIYYLFCVQFYLFLVYSDVSTPTSSYSDLPTVGTLSLLDAPSSSSLTASGSTHADDEEIDPPRSEKHNIDVVEKDIPPPLPFLTSSPLLPPSSLPSPPLLLKTEALIHHKHRRDSKEHNLYERGRRTK
jgi:hypothetical protein